MYINSIHESKSHYLPSIESFLEIVIMRYEIPKFLRVFNLIFASEALSRTMFIYSSKP